MNSTELQKLDEDTARFKKSLEKRFPSMTQVVALGSHTSRAMREDNRKRRIAALQKRASQRKGAN
jgi:hypothetical protein